MKNLKYFAYILLLPMFMSHSESANPEQFSSKNIELIISNGDTKIAGTLALPSEKLTDTLVIMLSGSGPQDKDETLDGFKVFYHLAKHFSEHGIPSFRFDDRGVGKSTGNFGQSTLSDHSNDVVKILEHFSKHDENRFHRFVLLGHSQGGIVAANVAIKRHDVKKVILMAAPSVPLIDIVLYQVRQDYMQMEVDIPLVEAGVSAHNRLIWAIQGNSKVNEAAINFEKIVLQVLTASPLNQNIPQEELKKKAARQTSEFKLIYALPSLTSFLYHDPAEELEDFTIPVLGLFGGKDLQVTITQNKDYMEKALLRSNVDYNFVTFEKANHYFQTAKTGDRDEYALLEKKFVVGFLETVSDWIKQK